MKKQTLIILFGIAGVFVLCIVACGIVFFISRSGNDDSSDNSDNSNETSDSANDNGSVSGQTYNCLYNSGDSVGNISGYQFELVVSDQEDVEWGESRPDNGDRSIPFDDFKNMTSDNRVYFSMKKADSSYIENMTMYLQSCNEDNEASFSSFLEDKSKNPVISNPGDGQSYSATTELPFFSIESKGKYRIDGLVYYQGQWKLVARMNQLEME